MSLFSVLMSWLCVCECGVVMCGLCCDRMVVIMNGLLLDVMKWVGRSGLDMVGYWY